MATLLHKIFLQGKSDERMKKSNEVLQTIKLIKLYAWEKIFQGSIESTRHQEIRRYLYGAFCRVISMLITDGAPLAATLIVSLYFSLLCD